MIFPKSLFDLAKEPIWQVERAYLRMRKSLFGIVKEALWKRDNYELVQSSDYHEDTERCEKGIKWGNFGVS